MKSNINKIIEKFNQFIISNLLPDENIKSIFVIGSMAQDIYSEKLLNDYDLRIIVHKPTKVLYDKIMDLLNKFVEQNSSSYSIEICDTVGPAFHKKIDDKNLLLHVLVMSLEDLVLLPKPHRLTYALNHKLLYGNDFLSQFLSIELSLEDITSCTEGLDYCLERLQYRTITYLKWDFNNNECRLLNCECPMDDNMLIEFCNYSIVKFIKNYLIYLKFNYVNIDETCIIRTIKNLSCDIYADNCEIIDAIVLKNTHKLRITPMNEILRVTLSLLELFKNKICNKEAI